MVTEQMEQWAKDKARSEKIVKEKRMEIQNYKRKTLDTIFTLQNELEIALKILVNLNDEIGKNPTISQKIKELEVQISLLKTVYDKVAEVL